MGVVVFDEAGDGFVACVWWARVSFGLLTRYGLTKASGAPPALDPFTDWTAYVAGDWTRVESSANAYEPEVVAEGGAIGGNILRWTPASTTRYALTWKRAGSTAAQEVLIKLKMTSDSIHPQGVLLRSNEHATPASYTAYLFRPRNKNSVRLHRINGLGSADAYIADGSGITALANGEYAWLRARVSGTTLNARIWKDGDSEPGSWQLTTTDATLADGALGYAVQAGFSVARDCDYFSYALDGDTAPGP